MIDESSYSEAVADELSLGQTAHAKDVADGVSLTSSAYGEDVAAAINNRPVGDTTLRVLQYNIGHFNMGYNAGVQDNASPTTDTVLINSTKADGYPNSIDRNYAIQLQRWKDCINGVGADIISMPEWNNYFGWNNGSVVTTVDSDIFNGYNISVGASEASGWWQNTLASKFAMSNAENVYLGSTNWLRAYLRVAKVVIKGVIKGVIKDVDVWIASTHLNWNNPNGSGGASASYASRQKEIKECVKWLQDKSHVILMGDFNATGPVYADSVPYAERNFMLGLDEFDPFINGFTENGVNYQGGCTLANNHQRPLLTADASYSRPDLTSGTDRPKTPYCYIDNIITKGFAMSNVQVIDDGRLTDHCGLYCDLTIID